MCRVGSPNIGLGGGCWTGDCGRGGKDRVEGEDFGTEGGNLLAQGLIGEAEGEDLPRQAGNS